MVAILNRSQGTFNAPPLHASEKWVREALRMGECENSEVRICDYSWMEFADPKSWKNKRKKSFEKW